MVTGNEKHVHLNLLNHVLHLQHSFTSYIDWRVYVYVQTVTTLIEHQKRKYGSESDRPALHEGMSWIAIEHARDKNYRAGKTYEYISRYRNNEDGRLSFNNSEHQNKHSLPHAHVVATIFVLCSTRHKSSYLVHTPLVVYEHERSAPAIRIVSEDHLNLHLPRLLGFSRFQTCSLRLRLFCSDRDLPAPTTTKFSSSSHSLSATSGACWWRCRHSTFPCGTLR